MNDTEKAREHAQKAAERAKRLSKELGRLLQESAHNFTPRASEDAFEQLQDAYTSALSAAQELQKSMRLVAGDTATRGACSGAATAVSGVETGVVYNQSTGVISCKIMAAPLLKKKVAANKFLELIGQDLHHKIIAALPQDFKKMREVYVIFVTHVERTATGKREYFDNDNLAIKGILDALIPYVCFDDAAKYCQNIYLYHEDTSDFTEVFIVPTGQLSAWVGDHEDLKFCRDFLQK